MWMAVFAWGNNDTRMAVCQIKRAKILGYVGGSFRKTNMFGWQFLWVGEALRLFGRQLYTRWSRT